MILDASAAALFLLPGEREPSPEMTRLLVAGPVLVPQHWWLEIASLLQNAERRGRIDAGGRDLAIARVRSWSVRVDAHTTELVWSDTLPMALARGLTIYDAAYLELSLRSGQLLASQDRALIAAARACAVEVLTALP